MRTDGGADGVDFNLAFEVRESLFDHVDDWLDEAHAIGMGDEALVGVVKTVVGPLLHSFDNLFLDLLNAMDFGARNESTFVADIQKWADM